VASTEVATGGGGAHLAAAGLFELGALAAAAGAWEPNFAVPAVIAEHRGAVIAPWGEGQAWRAGLRPGHRAYRWQPTDFKNFSKQWVW
jgi:hypothetical protein